MTSKMRAAIESAIPILKKVEPDSDVWEAIRVLTEAVSEESAPPTTQGDREQAERLVEQLERLGVRDVRVERRYEGAILYWTATWTASAGEKHTVVRSDFTTLRTVAMDRAMWGAMLSPSEPAPAPMRIDFHTASCAEVPCVKVFSTCEDGTQDVVLAEVHIGVLTVSEAEEAAERFMVWLEETKGARR